MNEPQRTFLTSLRPADSDAPAESQTADGAFRAFYESHVNFVRTLAIHLAGRELDPDDLVQDVFLRVYRHRAALISDDEARVRTPRPWLYRITVNAVNTARRRDRLRRLVGLKFSDGAETEAPDGHEQFANDEASQTLYRMLDRLPEKQRTVFVLFEIEQVPGKDIAKVLGCPLQTVWSRLLHARKNLYKAAARERARQASELGT